MSISVARRHSNGYAVFMMNTAGVAIQARCASCGQSGRVDGHSTPAWCKCSGVPGPFHALPGHAVLFTYMTPEQTADRDAARAVTNEYIDARDAGSDARWTDSGKRRPMSSKIYKTWLRRFLAAEAALDALQTACSHSARSFFSHAHCERCALLLDVEAT